MTSYQNTIMDLLQGDTPKAKHDYLVALILKDVSDRDQFAIGFAEWIQLNGWEHYPSDMIWIKNQDYMNGKETTELLALYKQSLTKTERQLR